jgi:hypothetical protein
MVFKASLLALGASAVPLGKIHRAPSLLSVLESRRSQASALKAVLGLDTTRMCVKHRMESLEHAMCKNPNILPDGTNVEVHDYRKWNHVTKKMYTPQEIEDLKIDLSNPVGYNASHSEVDLDAALALI